MSSAVTEPKATQPETSQSLSTVLITNGNLLSMLSLGDWLAEYGHALKAVIVTTKLPSTKSNVTGLFKMVRRSGFDYTRFKLNMNRFLPGRLSLRSLPTTVPDLLRHYGVPADVIYVNNVNDPRVIERICGYTPQILLSFSATSRFNDELIEVPARVAVNIHYALLPEYAGLSPYFWYLHHREPICGITMHVIHSKLDAGPIICQERFETCGINSVLGLLIKQMELVSPVLCRLYAGDLHEKHAVPQDLSKRSYFRHPTRQQIREFRRNSRVFTTPEDIGRIADTARRLRDRGTAADRAAVKEIHRRPTVSPEAKAVAECWYVPPPPTFKSGWLVYSLDFVLATLQGCVAEPHLVRRTWYWLIAGVIVRIGMAVGQALIMLLSWIPILSWFTEILARTFTRNAAGFFLRSSFWKARLKHLGADTIIDQGVEIWGAANVSIGSNCHIDTNVRLAAGERRHRQHGSIIIGNCVHLGPSVHIAGRGGVTIGDFVGMSANVHLYSATNTIEHPTDPGQLISMSHVAPRTHQHIIEKPIVIQEYAFVGMFTRIFPGVRIGRGAIVHANSELTRDVPAFANFGGGTRGRQIGWRKPRRLSSNLRRPASDPPRERESRQ